MSQEQKREYDVAMTELREAASRFEDLVRKHCRRRDGRVDALKKVDSALRAAIYGLSDHAD